MAGEGGAREQAPEVGVLIWGIGGGGAHCGGLTAATQVGGGEPAMIGWRSGGERWLGVCGAEVAMAMEEHAGGWRWHSMGGRPRQLKEAADLVLRRLLAADGGSAASLAWRRGTRGRCGLVVASTLGAKECGGEGAEDHGKSRAEWHRSVAVPKNCKL
jgi:hypothetical protein